MNIQIIEDSVATINEFRENDFMGGMMVLASARQAFGTSMMIMGLLFE